MAQLLKIPKRFRHEHLLWQGGLRQIAGVDEAGRGPLAGPVVAAAVIFPEDWIWSGLPKKLKGINDSKQLTANEREFFFQEIISRPEISFAIAQVEVDLIDQINILQATHRAMNHALAQLNPAPQHALVDGWPVKTLNFPHTALVDGDCLSYSIAAASILAKVTRDRLMIDYHRLYPLYHFHEHKGYGTPEHVAAIKQHGPCPIHRMTFSPLRPVQENFFDADESFGTI
ncbi:MAG: ribonuclease HII [Verrucomicrobiota bacterium]|nr:ribonuclease HII [Verrucomicrobiota bacterium]